MLHITKKIRKSNVQSDSVTKTVECNPSDQTIGRAIPQSIDFGNPAVYELLSSTAKAYPKNECVYYNGTKMTYGEVDEASSRFASALASIGVQKGDRVAIFLPNIPQFVISYFGILKAGATVVPCSIMYKGRELEHQLSDSGANFIVASKDVVKEKSRKDGKKSKSYNDLYKPVDECRKNLDITVVTTSVTSYLPGLKRKLSRLGGIRKVERQGTFDFSRLIKLNKPIEQLPDVKSRDDVAVLQYTGGTTGVSKGAMLTHYNLYSNAAYVSISFPMTKEDVSLCILPLYHIYGMTATMNSALYAGAKIVLLPKLHLKELMKTIQDQKVTAFCAVPAIYGLINDNPESRKYDLRSVRVCMSGGMELDATIRDKFVSLTGAKLVEGYGLSEASPVTHSNPLDGIAVKEGSVGIPITDTEARIVDPDDPTKVLASGEIGELAIKGPQVMKGYWNMEEETKRVLRDGWLLTGDLAKVDNAGYFYIVSRKKDMINVGGLKVYPREVESVLFENNAVKDVAVVSMPDKFSGEVVKAFVVLKENNTNVTEKEIIEYCTERLAKYKVPKSVEFVDVLPKSMIGKVLRRELRNGA